MTYEDFITNCENYARDTGQIFYTQNKEKSFEEFKAFCEHEGLDKFDNKNLLKWFEFDPLMMIDQLDSTNNERIKISGIFKDRIKLTTEIKKGNEKAITSEVKEQLREILGYEPDSFEGGSHIAFFRNKRPEEKFYLIQWFFALEPKENLIKKTAKELGMTYKELGEAIGYTEGGLKTAMTNDKISPQMEKAIELYLENINLKKELQKTKDFKNILKEFISHD